MGDEFLRMIPITSAFHPDNAVSVSIGDGLLNLQNSQLSFWNNQLSQMLCGSNVGSFINTPGIPAMLNPLDYLSSVNLSQLLQGGCNLPGFPAFGSGLDFGNFNPWGNMSTWGGTSTGGSNGSSSSVSETDKNNYNKTLDLLKKIKDLKSGVSNKTKKDIEAAIKEANDVKDSNDYSTKISKLKEVLEKDEVKKLAKKVILSDKTYKDKLVATGYNYNSTAYNEKDAKADEQAKAGASELEKLKNGEWDPLKYMTTSDNVISILSVWNSNHNDKHIMQAISEGLTKALETNKEDEGKGKESQKAFCESTTSFLNALITKAESIDGFEIGSSTELKNARDKVKELKDGLTTNNTTPEKLKEMGTDVDELYYQIRMAEAQAIKNTIKSDYEILGDIIDDNIVIEGTLEDLKAEGFKDADKRSHDIVKPEEKPVDYSELTPEDLTKPENKNRLAKATQITNHNVYSTGVKEYGVTRYYVEKDGNLYEIKGATGISGASFVKNDGTKIDIEKAIAEATKDGAEPVDIETVGNYSDQAQKLMEYVSAGKLRKITSNPPIYETTAKRKTGGHNYFVMKDNKLQKITNPKITKNAAGKFVVDIKQSIANGTTESWTENDIDIKSKETKQEPKKETTKNVHQKGEDIGKDIVDKTSGINTDEDKRKTVLNYLNRGETGINSSNVTDVIYGYRKNRNFHNSDGIIEQLSGESGDVSKVKNVDKIIDALESAVTKNGLEEDTDIKGWLQDIKDIQGKYNDKQDESYEHVAYSGGLFGDTDSENLDKSICKIAKKIREKLNLPTDGLEIE